MFLTILLILKIGLIVASKISPRRSLRGAYTPDIKNYQLLVPHKVNLEGDIQSFFLSQFFQHDFQSKRRKRDTSHPDMVCYNLHFNGQDHEILLWPNHGFIAPQTVAEFHYPGSEMTVKARKLRRVNPALCHYTGTIKGEDGSKAALSLCDGLAGYIKTQDGTFFIEPVEDFGPNEMGHHLHVIYEHPKSSTPADDKPERPQRGTRATGTTNCGTTSNWRNGWEKAFQQYFNTLQHNEMHEHNVVQRKSHNSVRRFLEVLVVADKMFVDFHKDKDYENYILTVMNMVSDYYHDGSTGNLLDVIVVRIIYLDQEISALDLSISPDASRTLESFCKWQHEINPKDVEHPQHHDIAVLVTRHDICSDSDDGSKNCGLLGLAYMASACVPSDACAINEDRGLILGVVIAHEIGHIMGCEHDIEEKSGCPAMADEKFYHVMSPYVSIATSVWSSCSRTYMTELLENNLGECLIDEPADSAYKFDEMTPGSMYDADYQCNLLFPNSTHCETDPEAFCEKLFCRVTPMKCISNGEPPAEGTKCGAHKWCMRQKCVTLGERPEGIDGGWGEWGDYGPCSRSCGGGIKISERSCTNPTPRNGGRYCVGESKQFKICNTKPCAEGSKSFRATQCSEFDKIPRSGRFHKWKPYYPTDIHGESACVLYCINEEHTYSKLSPRAKDGTSCKRGTYDMCVSGQCRRVGCDWILGSTAIEDNCGVCKGDNSGCKRISGTFTKGGKGYTKFVTLPRGARSIVIRETGHSDNTIAISSVNGKFYLNGDNQEEIDGEKYLGKDIGLYLHPELNQEEVYIAGPLKQSLNVYVVFYEVKNVGIDYEFYIRDKNYKSTRKANEDAEGKKGKLCYHWEFVEWSKCDRRCDGGEEKSEPECVSNNHEGVVSDDYCKPEDKPEAKTKVCNRQPCKVRWHTGEWGLCTGCEHQPGFQVRQVWCARESPRFDETDILTRDLECLTADGPRPSNKQLCVSPCPPNCRRNTRSSVKRSHSKLDKHFFKEFYREVDMMAVEPEGLFFGVQKGWDSNNPEISRNVVEPKLVDSKLKKSAHKLPSIDPHQLILEDLKRELLSSLHTAPSECSKEKSVDKCGQKCVDLETHLPSKFLNLPRIDVDGDRPVGIFIMEPSNKRLEEFQYEQNERLSRDSSISKPSHTVVKDKVDKSHLKLIVAPYIPPNPQNLSDEAFDKLGDKLSGSIDVEHEKVLKGDDAICAMKESNKNPELTEQPPPPEENSTERDTPDY